MEQYPKTKYHVGSGNPNGESALGLLQLKTNDGIDGYAFLGSATFSAGIDRQGIIQNLKPLLLNEEPLDREAVC